MSDESNFEHSEKGSNHVLLKNILMLCLPDVNLQNHHLG
jgi:hypothetical protein